MNILLPPPRSAQVLQDDGTFSLGWWRWVSEGYTGTVPLFGPHTNGTLTYVNGKLIAVVPPT